MAESRTANWMTAATALSTFFAAAALVFAVYEYHAKERAEEIAHWQRVLIHKVISDTPGITFQNLKIRYVTEATQLQSFRLPSKEIQDDALRYNLLSLQRDRLIIIDPDSRYYATSEMTTPDLFSTLIKPELEGRQSFRVGRPAVLRLLEREPGRYTTDDLYQRCRDEKISIQIDDYYNLINDLRTQRLINRDDQGKLWPTYEIETAPSAPQPEPTAPSQEKGNG